MDHIGCTVTATSTYGKLEWTGELIYADEYSAEVYIQENGRGYCVWVIPNTIVCEDCEIERVS